jgi:hypothetical protein
MGSPQYGRLVLDGKSLPTRGSVESRSLTWSADRHLLAAQELVSWLDEPETRVIVVDAERRIELAATRARKGFSTPLRFEDDGLVYSHAHRRFPERELRLPLTRQADNRQED